MLPEVPKLFLLAGALGLAAETAAASHGASRKLAPPAQSASRPCSLDGASKAEQQRLISGYRERLRTQGKAAARSWARAEGNRLYRQLVAEGVCPPPRQPSPQAARRPEDKPVRNKQGKPCKRIEVENQVFPNFGGGPMTMGLVSVCKD